MEKTIDCVICGSCVVDILVRPVPLTQPIGRDRLIEVEPLGVATGGVVSNSGIAMSRLGLRVAALSYVGDDPLADIVRKTYQESAVETSHLMTHPDLPTSSTIVLVDTDGHHTFLHNQGAPRGLTADILLDRIELLHRSRAFLLGYYSLMPNLEQDLPDVLARVRAAGCLTALDAAGSGGTMQPLDGMLPHLDVYVPSFGEASSQTGEKDPEKIIDRYRECGAPGILGVKLGADGALLSDGPGSYLSVDPVAPPAALVDTTGAGDAFYAGLLTGLLRSLPLADAGRLAAAAGACCVTGLGASAGIREFDETARLAGLRPSAGR